jgi:hypothetical protein
MPSTIIEDAKKASINLADHPVVLDGPTAEQPAVLIETVAKLLSAGPGFCVAYGTAAVLARHGISIRQSQDVAHDLLESVFRGAMKLIAFEEFTVTPRPMTLAHMDVDGFNLNGDFSHDGSVQSRAFMTSKCIHFDAATPFIANTYGLNENIGGGHPLICDVRQYCLDKGVDAADLVEAIPNNYNVAIREAPYQELLDEYSVALDVDIDNDIVMIMLLNEIAYGVAHGATPPFKIDPAAECRRPIRHFEYQFGEEAHYVEWYGRYKVPMVQATDYAGENLSLDYHNSSPRPFDRLVRIGA